MDADRCRILALDGGGVRGAFSAAVLAELEGQTGKTIVEHFDLVVGTSTGAILAIGLGLGLSPGEIEALYTKKALLVFPGVDRASRLVNRVRHLLRNKRDPEGLRSLLNDAYGQQKLGHSKVRLVIPTFDALKGEACTFKTAHHEALTNEYLLPAVEVALASAAAPTYFPAAQLSSRPGASYIDGGVWANDPVLVGIVEAVHFLNVPLDRISVLSVGTTGERREYAKKARAGVFGWGAQLLDLFSAGQATSAGAMAKLLLGDRYLRIDIATPAATFEMDDGRPATASGLAALGHSLGRDGKLIAQVEEQFLDGKSVQKFVPWRSVDPTSQYPAGGLS